MKLMIGMTDGFDYIATHDGPASGTVGAVSWKALEVRDVETLIPSFKGARVGLYPDALLATSLITANKRYWIEVTGISAGVAQVFGKSVSVVSQVFTWPVPFYMEMNLDKIGVSNGYPDLGPNFDKRIQLAKDYAKLLKEHGIQPIKNAVTVYPDTTLKNFKWDELVTANPIAPPCLFGPAPGNPPSVALLNAIETALKAGTLPANSWAYLWDEGEFDATASAQALSVAKLVKSYAPSLRTMMTRQASTAFDLYVDVYVPVINWFNQPGYVPSLAYAGKTVWLYQSCMSAGRCTNATDASQVGPPTRFPLSVIEVPQDAERFVTEAVAAGATGLLYYNTTEAMTNAFKPGGQYLFGNNGDGQHLYAGMGVSRRLKLYRRGLNAVAWKKAGSTP